MTVGVSQKADINTSPRRARRRNITEGRKAATAIQEDEKVRSLWSRQKEIEEGEKTQAQEEPQI